MSQEPRLYKGITGEHNPIVTVIANTPEHARELVSSQLLRNRSRRFHYNQWVKRGCLVMEVESGSNFLSTNHQEQT
jgi:hypothetical protein